MLKMAVSAPIPTPRMSTAKAKKPASRRRERRSADLASSYSTSVTLTTHEDEMLPSACRRATQARSENERGAAEHEAHRSDLEAQQPLSAYPVEREHRERGAH